MECGSICISVLNRDMFQYHHLFIYWMIWSFPIADKTSAISPTYICLHCYSHTVYPKKYAHGFVVFCFVVVMQSLIMNSHVVFIHIHQGCFAGTGAIVRLPQCQWSKPDGYGKTSQCITTTKHSKAKTVCIFLGIYCTLYYDSKCIFCLAIEMEYTMIQSVMHNIPHSLVLCLVYPFA